MASVTFLCPSCSAEVTTADRRPACAACAATITLRADLARAGPSPIADCAACGSQALYLAKDFNKNLGVAVVLLGCIGFFWGAIVGISTLVLLTVADRIVYWQRPVVTVCYACKAVYRGLTQNPSHKGYELTYDESFEGTGEALTYEAATVPGPR